MSVPADAAAHVFVADIAVPEIDDDTGHHLRRVRRLRPGVRCTATDGAGAWRWCRLGEDGSLEPDGEVVRAPRATPEIVIAFALTKGGKPELVVQKLTELGIDRIVPFRAEHSVVRWDGDKAADHHRRWQAVVVAALEQSRGCWLPRVDPVADLDSVVGLGAIRLDRGGRAPSLRRPVLAVGPEGGWSDAERAALPETVGIATNVLRAETAALTAGGVMTSLRSGAVRERDVSGGRTRNFGGNVTTGSDRR